MPKKVTIEEVADAYKAANPGTPDDAALAWARSEVRRQAARKRWDKSDGNGAEPQAQPEAPANWRLPMYEAARVLQAVDSGETDALEGLQAAVVLLMQCAAEL